MQTWDCKRRRIPELKGVEEPDLDSTPITTHQGVSPIEFKLLFKCAKEGNQNDKGAQATSLCGKVTTFGFFSLGWASPVRENMTDVKFKHDMKKLARKEVFYLTHNTITGVTQ